MIFKESGGVSTRLMLTAVKNLRRCISYADTINH